jgi:hypothetical protein
LEWNFSDCPADELSLCVSYEYSRASRLIRETVKRKREGGEDSLCDAVFFIFPFNAIWTHSHWWPDTPYLAIPSADRRTHLVRSPPPLKARKDLADFCTPGPSELHDAERLVLVYIPPGWRLSWIKRGFGQMILRDYAHLLEKPVSSFKRRKTGKGSPHEQWRSALIALSAWRLKEHGYTGLQALELACSHRVQLYAGERSYRNAVRKARERIRGLEEQLRQYAAEREPRYVTKILP